MLDSAMLATAVRDEDGRIVDFVVDYINPVAEIGQRPAGEIVGRRFLDVWPSAAGSPIWGMMLHLMETGEPITLDNFVYSEVIDGRAVTAAFDIRMTRLGDGFLDNFRDVTERYRMQQDLEASERRFRSALDALMDPFFMFVPVRDGQGKIVDLEFQFVNEAAERLYQMPRQDIVGHGLLELFPSGRELGIWDTYLEPIKTGTPARVDLPYFDEHGVKGLFEVSLTPGDEGLIISARDVSEARQAQEALQASEKRFRSALDALMDPFFILGPVRDDQGKIVELEYRYVNRAAERLYQMPRQDIVGHGLTELFPSVRELGIWDTYVESIETGTTARTDSPYFNEHGVAGLFELSVTPGDEGLLVAARDVSEARQAQEALRASEERFRTSVEALQDGFAVFSAIRDSAGVIADFRYEYINEAGCRMDQRSREDTVGHTLTELFPASVTSGLLAAYALVAETGEPLTREDVDYEDVYGGRRVSRALDIRVVKLGDGIVATWRDVAERRRAEETMTRQAVALRRNAAELEDRVRERTADLVRSNQELASFGYSVAHDLRAPLRAIDGYCQILLDEHAAQLDEDGQVLLGDVGRYAVRMGHLIEGMLALARIGRKDLGHVRIDMTALAESVVTDLRRGHAGAWPAIAVGQLADASGAPELIRQVWENLIGNAVKFSANQPDAQVSVESQEAAGEVIYHVRDNGVGFDMAYAGKLFGVFQRLHPADFPGTGIGLAIVARIVERLGGRVWAEGRVGDGACFSFALPAPSTENGETP